MTSDQLSLILLPTNKCNVACEVMIMQPEWFERAHELISSAASRRSL